MTSERASQCERILQQLRYGPICGATLHEWGIHRAAARIFELRKQGWMIESRKCRTHIHPQSRQIEYVLTAGSYIR